VLLNLCPGLATALLLAASAVFMERAPLLPDTQADRTQGDEGVRCAVCMRWIILQSVSPLCVRQALRVRDSEQQQLQQG
jgi:hypothetical protein